MGASSIAKKYRARHVLYLRPKAYLEKLFYEKRVIVLAFSVTSVIFLDDYGSTVFLINFLSIKLSLHLNYKYYNNLSNEERSDFLD